MPVTIETEVDDARRVNRSWTIVQQICPGCKSDDLFKPFEKRHDWMLKCNDCDLMWASPQPTDAQLAEIYGPDYYNSFGFDKQHGDVYHQMKRMQAKILLDRIPESDGKNRRLLDVGSAVGDLLVVAGSRGYDAVGIESNRFAVEAAQSILPGKTECHTLDSYSSCNLKNLGI